MKKMMHFLFLNMFVLASIQSVSATESLLDKGKVFSLTRPKDCCRKMLKCPKNCCPPQIQLTYGAWESDSELLVSETPVDVSFENEAFAQGITQGSPLSFILSESGFYTVTWIVNVSSDQVQNLTFLVNAGGPASFPTFVAGSRKVEPGDSVTVIGSVTLANAAGNFFGLRVQTDGGSVVIRDRAFEIAQINQIQLPSP